MIRRQEDILELLLLWCRCHIGFIVAKEPGINQHTADLENSITQLREIYFPDPRLSEFPWTVIHRGLFEEGFRHYKPR